MIVRPAEGGGSVVTIYGANASVHGVWNDMRGRTCRRSVAAALERLGILQEYELDVWIEHVDGDPRATPVEAK